MSVAYYLLIRKEILQLKKLSFLCISLSIVLIYMFLTYYFQIKTFFLGDGYTLLASLADSNPLTLKYRQLIESLAHIHLFNLIGGEGMADAIASSRLISHVGFIFYIFISSYLSRVLFEEQYMSRLLFFLGLLSNGNMLLYFGYVENYSLFNCSVLLYFLIGVLVLKNKINIWVLLLFNIVLMFFHIFGIFFIPISLYLLYRKSFLQKWFIKQSKYLRYISYLVILLIPLSGVWYYYNSDYFVQLAFVPLVNNLFTQDGYTLFSISHILDIVNLLVMLFPGIFICLLVIFFLRSKIKLDLILLFFLLSTILSLVGVIIFDPKLGMPRDWDLFSFSVIPLSMLFLYQVLTIKVDRKYLLFPLVLVVCLGFIFTFSRAYNEHNQNIAVNRFYSYLNLDKAKSRNAWLLLYNYYNEKQDSSKAEEIYAEWKSRFPEEKLIAQANKLYYQENNIQQTIELLHQILKINPSYSDAYSFLGKIYLDSKKLDSAEYLIRYADALSPNRPNNINNLAITYYLMSNYDKAEYYYVKATQLDTLQYIYPYNAAKFYAARQQKYKYLQYLELAASKKDAPIQIKRELFNAYLLNKQIEKAEYFLNNDTLLNRDSLFLIEIEKRYNIKIF